MPKPTRSSVCRALLETTAGVAWRQWAELGSTASASKRATSLVDPEALLLVSLALREHERRLWDVAAAWARRGAQLLSVQRVKNLRAGYPDAVAPALTEFAALARSVGRDARWKERFFGKPRKLTPARAKGLDVDPDFATDPALWLRLRRGFGVNLRADILALLLGLSGQAVTVRVAASVLHYTPMAIRRTAEELAAARLIIGTVDDQPTTYSLEPGAWRQFLELREIPRWRHWNEMFAFAAAVAEWEKSLAGRTVSDDAFETLGLELIQRHRAAFSRTQLGGTGSRLPLDTSFTDCVMQLIDHMEHVV